MDSIAIYLFRCLSAFWFLSEIFTKQDFSYVALGITIILVTQAIIQNKTIGVSLGIFAVVVNTIFFLAVLSEFSEFEVISGSAMQLITVGSILSLSGFAMGIIMTTTNGKKLTM